MTQTRRIGKGKVQLKRLLGPVVGAVFALLVVAAPASAYTDVYCGYTVAPGVHCKDNNEYHSWVGNNGSYNGGGTLAAMCEGMSNSSGQRFGGQCFTQSNTVSTYYGATGTYWNAFVYMASSNGASHTILGQAYT